MEATDAAIRAACPEADAVSRYQAEEVLAALCTELAATGRPAALRRWTGPPVPDLDVLPLPAWGLVDLEARDRFMARIVEGLGRGPLEFPIDGRTLPAVTSRGCPYRCVHCSSNPGRGDGAAKTQQRLSPSRARRRVHRGALEAGARRPPARR